MKVNYTISNEDNSVNSQNEGTIESCPSELEIPFAMTPLSIIRSREISPECGHLIINLLSNVAGWKINMQQLVNRYEGFWGRDKVYKIMNEAIAAGYIKKEYTKDKGKFGLVKYFVSRTPKFKKCSPHPGLPDTVSPDTANTHIKNIIGEEDHKQVVCVAPPPVASSPPLSDHKKIQKKTFDGQIIEVSKNDLIEKCISRKKDWSELELDSAWNVFLKYENSIRDWFELISGIINNIRKMGALKNIKEEINQKDKSCKKEMTREEKELKRQQENSKYETSEKGTWGLHFQSAS